MSSIIRYELESYINHERNVISRQLRDVIAKAIRERNHEVASIAEDFDSTIQVFKPVKSDFVSPKEYTDSLRSYAFTISIVDSIIRNLGITEESIRMAKMLINIAKEGAPIGKMAEDAKKLLGSVHDGDKVYLEGCIAYINVLVGKVKEPDDQELFITREALSAILTEDRPISRLSDLAKMIGTRESDLYRLLQKISDKDNNFVATKNYVFFRDRMKSYIEKIIGERAFVGVEDLAKDWNLKPSNVLEVISKITPIFPDIIVIDKRVLTTIKAASEKIYDFLKERPVWSINELVARINVNKKSLEKILESAARYIPDLLKVNLEIIANRENVVKWIEDIIGDRISVYIDEIAGKIGASKQKARILAEEAARLSGGNLVVGKDKIYYRPNISSSVRQAVEEGEATKAEQISKEASNLVEEETYMRIGTIINKLLEKVGGK